MIWKQLMVTPELVKMPGLCLLCRKNDIDDPVENLLCTMNRYDQRNEKEFKCGVFERKE
jgi:hypothetical protein